MAFLCVIMALMLEQARAVNPKHCIYRMMASSLEAIENIFHASHEKKYGAVALVMFCVIWVASAAVLWFFLSEFSLVFGGLFSLWVLYLSVGFRQFSQVFTDLQLALNQGDRQRAAQVYSQWRTQVYPEFEFQPAQTEPARLVRQCVEYALVAAYRQVFAVLFWFIILPGPTGAVLYRIVELAVRSWQQKSNALGTDFNWAAQRFLGFLDYFPVRLTGLSYAAAGQFEEATLAWRAQINDSQKNIDSSLVAVGLGALGLRIGSDVMDIQTNVLMQTIWTGQTLASTTRLIWRSLGLWMVVLFLLTVVGPVR